MKKIGIVTFFLLFIFSAFAQNNLFKIEGTVFHDKNGNGKFDGKEKGVRGIPVSNGDTIVFTDKMGRFEMQADSVSSIFPILPSGFHMNGSRVVNANFFYLSNGGSNPEIDFGLNRVKENSQFSVGAIGDVQVSDRQEIGYANNTVMDELANRTDLKFNLFLGDLVNDNVEDLFLFRQMLEALPVDSWTIAGNHDRDEVIGKQQHTYSHLFGAVDYAFNYADVHFVVLNNVYAKGHRGYEGRFTEKQIRFVKNDLALVPENKLLVLCQHIPMVLVKNKADMLSLLDDRKNVLILSGHTHRVSRHYLAPNIMEIVAGASCGNWWTGERDWQGIPSALMQGGSPRNYFTIDFDKNNYQFQFKGVRLDPAMQMSIWISGQDSLDKYVPALQELGQHTVVANIYAGSEETIVKMQIDDSNWVEMEKKDLVDPNIERIIAINKLDATSSRFARKAALRQSKSSHIWTGEIPENLSKGIHVVKIRAVERSAYNVCDSRIFIW